MSGARQRHRERGERARLQVRGPGGEAGVEGGCAAFEPIAKLSNGVASGPSPAPTMVQRSLVVVNRPQPSGVASSARGPPKKCIFRSENGSCAFSGKICGQLARLRIRLSVPRRSS